MTGKTIIQRTIAATALLGAIAAPGLVLAGPAAAAAAPVKTCKSVTHNISYLNIAKTGNASKGNFTCQQANAVSNTWMLRFNARMPVKTIKLDNLTYTCKLVPTLPRNTQCVGAGTRIKFSAPTGG